MRLPRASSPRRVGRWLFRRSRPRGRPQRAVSAARGGSEWATNRRASPEQGPTRFVLIRRVRGELVRLTVELRRV
jgi:hypothetical protein